MKQESSVKVVNPFKSWLLVACAALAGACSSDEEAAGSGSARFTIWGEEYIEDAIPADIFTDGWSADFERFLIVVGDVSVADSQAGEGGRIAQKQLFNLVSPGPHDVGTISSLEARAWNTVGYVVAPFDADTAVHSSASNADRATMEQGGFSLFVSGSATKGTESKTFAWGFGNVTHYDRCVADEDGRETRGIVVTNGGTDTVQLTIHGDHFFYDDLASPAARPRFQAMFAADADSNGEVTLEELTNVKLVDIPEGTYGTGSASHVDDLGAFVRALTATVGHFRGEGHCAATPG
jgi:hypothetical protein